MIIEQPFCDAARRWLLSRGALVLFLAGALWPRVDAGEALSPPASRGFEYRNDTVKSVPWSIHVLKLDRAHHELKFHTTMGKGTGSGMGVVSQQVKSMEGRFGVPIAAVNGDFYSTTLSFAGDPEGLQIVAGELVSAPASKKVCFWIDAQGNPCRSNVVSKFQVTWPDSSTTALGLNQERTSGSAVLYTAAVGSSTRSAEGGLEMILETAGSGPWLPLQASQTYNVRVRSMRHAGDTPLTSNWLVLSLSKELASAVHVKVGDKLQVSTETTPDLRGIQTAIGGGPTLVTAGRAHEWGRFEIRHPRTAIGWNEQAIWLVVVDGRQRGLSAGMTLSELAKYMVKLGCSEAMNLDGGGSATMWLAGGVANSPSEGRERPCANALVIVRQAPDNSSAR